MIKNSNDFTVGRRINGVFFPPNPDLAVASRSNNVDVLRYCFYVLFHLHSCSEIACVGHNFYNTKI